MNKFVPGEVIKSFKSRSDKEIKLRYPRWKDLEQLMNFINGLVEEDTFIMMNEKQDKKKEAEYLSEALTELELGKRVQLLAFDNEKLIGNAAIEKQTFRSKHVGLANISVRKGYREEGIGYQLFQAVIGEAIAKLELKLLVLTVFDINERAIEFYKSFGFKKAGTIPEEIEYKGEYVGHAWMYKKL